MVCFILSGMKTMPDDPTILKEYDFRDAVKGKYSARYSEETKVIVIYKSVMAYFPDHDAENQALKSVISINKHDMTIEQLASH